ncbi:LL-diaminopimelate aminotransferase [Peptococcaceae bacterium CEB3]|nr:LL-diaminopimelate aminotransferase [Peptococcaceae bacterium CEB3]
MLAQRMQGLGVSVFSRLDELRLDLLKQGKDLINLTIGSPDRPPAPSVREALSRAALDERNYGYTLTRGSAELRESCAAWYQRRFGVDLDPEREVLPLMGSQDGLAHVFWAYIDPGDPALIPDPGYPIYTAGLLLAGGVKIPLPLRAENGFLPDLEEVEPGTARRAKILFLNYPNNPTAAVAPLSFFQRVADFARQYHILVCHDAAYSELAFEGYRPVSFLQAEGAKEVGIEFHSLSKTYNFAGARLGFAVGNAQAVEALTAVKSNIDYGGFAPVLRAGVEALAGRAEVEVTVAESRRAYQRRRDIWLEGCARAGWTMPAPQASMFVWAPVPGGGDSFRFAVDLAREAGVLVVPGVAFGAHGEGYVRVALVQEESVMREATERIGRFLGHKG